MVEKPSWKKIHKNVSKIYNRKVAKEEKTAEKTWKNDASQTKRLRLAKGECNGEQPRSDEPSEPSKKAFKLAESSEKAISRKPRFPTNACAYQRGTADQGGIPYFLL